MQNGFGRVCAVERKHLAVFRQLNHANLRRNFRQERARFFCEQKGHIKFFIVQAVCKGKKRFFAAGGIHRDSDDKKLLFLHSSPLFRDTQFIVT